MLLQAGSVCRYCLHASINLSKAIFSECSAVLELSKQQLYRYVSQTSGRACFSSVAVQQQQQPTTAAGQADPTACCGSKHFVLVQAATFRCSISRKHSKGTWLHFREAVCHCKSRAKRQPTACC